MFITTCLLHLMSKRFLKKLRLETPSNLATPLLGISPKAPKASYYTAPCILVFIAA